MEPSKPLDLEKELTCSICTEILYQPLTVLDCLHTFCGSCLKEWFDHIAARARSNPHSPPTTVYTCPSCRSPVRDTGHNATVVTLLDMFLAANPERGRSRDEKDELATRYRPGDVVLPKPASSSLSSSSWSSSTAAARGPGTGTGATSTRGRREGGAEDRATRERRRRNYEEGRQVEHQASLRSLIGSADMSERDIEREIEEFAKQIQEEGLLDGLDLDNVDLSRDDELSRRITEAYRRRQRGRAGRRVAPAGGARTSSSASSSSSSSSSASHHRSVEGRSRPASTSNVTTHSRSASATSQATDESRPPPRASSTVATVTALPPPPPPPPTSGSSQHLEVHAQSSGDRRRRRATSGGPRSSTTSAHSLQPSPRLHAHSQTELGSQPPRSQAPPPRPLPTTDSSPGTETSSRPPVSNPNGTTRRSSSSPTVPTTTGVGASSSPVVVVAEPSPSSSSSNNNNNNNNNNNILSFASRAASASLPPSTATEANAPTARAPRSRQRPAELSILNMTVPTTSHGGGASRSRSHGNHFREPIISCSSCRREHIEYELHYNCAACDRGDWNLCLDCYRAGKGCQGWYGFGHAAWAKWERARRQAAPDETPPARSHVLTANRYRPPKTTPGGAEGRRTLTHEDPYERLESGSFCARCLAWSNHCWWRCDACNDGDWGFCNSCVNQGLSCSHPLLPLTYEPPPLAHRQQPPAPPPSPGRPTTATLLPGPATTSASPYKPLTFRTRCDTCQEPISPDQARNHCFSCTSILVPDAAKGDYDICMECYEALVAQDLVSADNGPAGWRRCLGGHRMVVVAFRNGKGGQWRHVLRELVGGRGLRVDEVEDGDDAPLPALQLQRWSWYESSGQKVSRFVYRDDVAKPLPAALERQQHPSFPPEGGVGATALAVWGWLPPRRQGDQGGGQDGDDLAFPRGAEVGEVEDINGEWWYGAYMGKDGVFPAPYVRVIRGEPLRVSDGGGQQ